MEKAGSCWKIREIAGTNEGRFSRKFRHLPAKLTGTVSPGVLAPTVLKDAFSRRICQHVTKYLIVFIASIAAGYVTGEVVEARPFARNPHGIAVSR